MTHQTRQRFINLLLSNFGEPVWIVASVSCSKLTGAAPRVVFFRVRHVLRSEMVFCIRWFVTSGYLSYCCLSIIFNQSAHSPLTSDINKAFSSTQLPIANSLQLLIQMHQIVIAKSELTPPFFIAFVHSQPYSIRITKLSSIKCIAQIRTFGLCCFVVNKSLPMIPNCIYFQKAK